MRLIYGLALALLIAAPVAAGVLETPTGGFGIKDKVEPPIMRPVPTRTTWGSLPTS